MNTVIVVGAGASKDFGQQMPTGAELANRIEAMLSAELSRTMGPGPISDALRRSPTGLSGAHQSAMARIRDTIGGKDSIDDFIAEWNHVEHLAQVAKLCIAEAILDAERKTSLASEEAGTGRNEGLKAVRDSWLGQLLRYANPRSERRVVDEATAGLSFVTFNYDRCIEQFLTGWFRMQGVPQHKLESALNAVPVHHVYGALGALPSVGGEMPFGADDPWATGRAASKIKTYTEALTPAECRAISDQIATAENVVMLGIGFHSQNLRLLFGKEGYQGRQSIWATTMGLRQRQSDRVRQYFKASGKPVVFHDDTATSMMTVHRDDILDP